jgi:hypothetical protein
MDGLQPYALAKAVLCCFDLNTETAGRERKKDILN